MHAARHDQTPVIGSPPPPTLVTSWMTVGEARAALVAAGQRALPVVGHDGLIGLVTIEALSGSDEGRHPAPEDPLLSVMDWHLVQVPPDADDRQVAAAYAEAARTWARARQAEATAPTAFAADPQATDPLRTDPTAPRGPDTRRSS